MGFKITRELNESESENLSSYGVNAVDDTTTASVTYVGMEDSAGNWIIKKLDETTNLVITYATIKNNPTLTTLSDAWDYRATTLVYNDYNIAF